LPLAFLSRHVNGPRLALMAVGVHRFVDREPDVM
jgi:hypothetical protein